MPGALIAEIRSFEQCADKDISSENKDYIMCGTCFGHGVLAAIFAAIFGVLFFNGLWLQFRWAGAWGTSAELGMLFVQYIVAFFFLGAAKMVMWKGMEKHKAAGKKR